jgi:hypothetical protein
MAAARPLLCVGTGLERGGVDVRQISGITVADVKMAA